MGRPRVLLADDHTMVVEVIEKLLEIDFDVVGKVHDGRTLVRIAPELRPDAILLDMNLPQLGGREAGQELKRLMPQTKLIVLTVNEDSEMAANALRSWASGYLLKTSAGHELTKAIWEALRGRTYVTPKIAQKLPYVFIRNPRPPVDKELTDRQRQVLQLLAEGRTMKEAADLLQVTPRTIAFHKYRIMEEFNLKSNSDLVKFAIREGVISSR